MKRSKEITGRDGYILAKSLAYAITAIKMLPERWQEWSDKEDMKLFFEVAIPSTLRVAVMNSAHHHLRQELGYTIDETVGR
jgi:hypothetical protein